MGVFPVDSALEIYVAKLLLQVLNTLMNKIFQKCAILFCPGKGDLQKPVVERLNDILVAYLAFLVKNFWKKNYLKKAPGRHFGQRLAGNPLKQ